MDPQSEGAVLEAPALVVMAKEPTLGTVKTRLASVLGPHEVVELYRAFLLDKADQVAAVPGVVPQRGADLGERLAVLCEELLERHTGVLLVDSDTPNLPQVRLTEATRALQRCDVVFGPALDGGYYLIGRRRFERACSRTCHGRRPPC